MGLQDMFQLWNVKIFLGVILTLFAPVQTSIIIVFIMILLDAITGIWCAMKSKRFNSRTLKKNLKKVVIYSACILTIRLVEVGALTGFETTILTQFMAGFLIITEAISILENLTILGLPIPMGYINVLFKQIRMDALEEIIRESQKEIKGLEDIEDIIYYQVPTIKSENKRKLLKIKFEAWLQVAKEIINYFDRIQDVDNDLIYYKVISIIQVGMDEMQRNWEEGNIPAECVRNFNNWHSFRLHYWLADVKDICYRITSPNKKKDELIKKITILIYQTVLDVQKSESEIGCEY